MCFSFSLDVRGERSFSPGRARAKEYTNLMSDDSARYFFFIYGDDENKAHVCLGRTAYQPTCLLLYMHGILGKKQHGIRLGSYLRRKDSPAGSRKQGVGGMDAIDGCKMQDASLGKWKFEVNRAGRS